MPYLTLNVPENSGHLGLNLSSGISRKEMRSTTMEAPGTTISVMASDPAADASALSEYPLVRLDTETITDATAARLATSLLGHILFLKNQVPLPVMQLARISNAKTNPRSLKQRQDLLNSFDTISSHLETTFSALSTALARSRSYDDSPLARAYLAFLVGPGIRTAKARVILGIDGLEKRIWGSRDNPRLDVADKSSDSEDDVNTEEGDDSEGNDEEAEEPDNSEDDETDEDSASTDNSDAESSRHEGVLYVSRAEEEKKLQNADRLLSRVLASADANGKGMSSEMAPTQTHILMRAPRRFVHPAWIPFQSSSAFLDGLLDEFLQGSGQQEVSPDLPIQRPNKAPKVEGVWITTRTEIQKPPCPASSSWEEKKSTIHDDEDDELIWWSWDGKLWGFADW